MEGANQVYNRAGGTGAAVKLNSGNFDPVRFQEKRQLALATAKAAKEKQRRDDLSKMDVLQGWKPKSQWQVPLIVKMAEEGKKVFPPAQAETGQDFLNPATALGQQFIAYRSAVQGSIADADRIENELQAAQDILTNPTTAGKVDAEETAAAVKRVRDAGSIPEMMAALQQEGSLIKQAYDLEDLASQMSVLPTETPKRKGSVIVPEVVWGQQLLDEAKSVVSNPKNRPAIEYLARKQGVTPDVIEEQLIEEHKRAYKPSKSTYREATGGGSGSGANAKKYTTAVPGYEGAFPGSPDEYNTITFINPQPITVFDDEGNPVYTKEYSAHTEESAPDQNGNTTVGWRLTVTGAAEDPGPPPQPEYENPNAEDDQKVLKPESAAQLAEYNKKLMQFEEGEKVQKDVWISSIPGTNGYANYQNLSANMKEELQKTLTKAPKDSGSGVKWK